MEALTDEQRAQMAMSLRDNEMFQEALAAIREDARDGLCRTPATDIEAIRDHQAIVKVVDEFRDRIDTAIRSGAAPKKAGIA